MADEFDALWESTPAAAPANAPVTFDSLWESTPATPSGALPALGEIGQGLTFGYLDEIEGHTSALGNLLKSVVGMDNGLSYGQNYAAKKAATEAELAAYEQANPKSSLALQVLGGVIPSVGASGVAALKGATAAAPGALSTLARNVFGVGITESPSVMQLAKMGATQGALMGSGNAAEGDRLEGALKGGAVGTIAAPVVGKTLEGVFNYIGGKAAESGMLDRLAQQRGSLSSDALSTGYSPEEIFLAKQLKNTPIQKVIGGANEMATVSDDVPIFLPEAVGSPKVDRNARFIANYEPSLEFSQDAINRRTIGAEARASELLNAVSPEANQFEGAQKMVSAAEKIIDKAKTQRFLDSDPLYQQAYKERPLITDPDFKEFFSKDKFLQGAVKEVKKNFEFSDLPDNHAKVLVHARSELGDKIALSAGGAEKSRLQSSYNKLNEFLHSKGDGDSLVLADATYRHASGGIDELNESFLSNLSRMSDNKINNVGQIFNLPAEQIKKLRTTYADNGMLDEWNAGVRAHLQNTVEGAEQGKDFTRKLVGNTLQKERLEAALGDSFETVSKGLDYESRFFQGKNKYHAGSSTAGNLDEKANFDKGVGILSSIRDGKYVDALATFFSGNMDEDLAREMARIYFDPNRGSEAINKIIPLLKQYAKTKMIAGNAGTLAGKASTIEGSRYGQAKPATAQAPRQLEQQTILDALSEAEAALSKERSLKSEMTGNQSVVDKSLLQPTSSKNATPYGFVKTLLGGKDVDYQEVREIDGGKFVEKVGEIADGLGVDPKHLLDVMHFETGGTFDPAQKNKAGSGATGLIQFMPATAKEITGEKTRDAAIKVLADMTATEQLDYVKKYLAPFKGKLNSLEDVYMAVLWPKAVGKDSDYALFKEGTTAYWQNRGLDIDGDGIITKAEAANKVKSYSV